MQQQDETADFAPRARVVSGERWTPVAEEVPSQRSAPSESRVTSAEVVSLDSYRYPERTTAAPAPITSLYRDRAHSNPRLARAVDLLEEGRRAVIRSLEAVSEGHEIAADDAMQELQALLPELFLCRDLGDGYAAIVAGLHFAFENRRGQALEEHQIRAVQRVLTELHMAPFMSMTSGYLLLARLEENGLIVTPKSSSFLFQEDNAE